MLIAKGRHTMDKTVDHYEIPADGERHEFQLTVPPKILHTMAREDDVVEFWATNQPGMRTQRVQLIAYATGQLVPEWSDWRGSAVSPNGTEWHLFEEFDPDPEEATRTSGRNQRERVGR